MSISLSFVVFRLPRAFAVMLAAFQLSGTATADQSAFDTLIEPVLKKHCVKCHGAKTTFEGEVNLQQLHGPGDLAGNLGLLRGLIDVLDKRDMPPEDEPPLDPTTRRKLVAHLNALLHATLAKSTTFPQTPLRRMNRFQYNNAVRDLFQLNCTVLTLPERMMREHSGYFKPASGKMPNQVRVGSRPLGKSQLIEPRLAGVAAFPQDRRAEHGFDNRGDHLSLSPLLLESFFSLSRTIIESPDFGPRRCGIWNSFFAEPKTSGAVKKEIRDRLHPFLTRAFRRPADDALVGRYTNHVLAGIRSGQSFSDSMKSAASAAIASPRFFYLYDRAGASQTAEPLDDFEIASRLSFFLWGSIPDQVLLDLATAGKLSDPAVLAGQIDRMLNDRRIKRFCDSFPAQWLQLERIISTAPDPELFPEFYFVRYRTSMHMMLEPLLIFETVLIENRSILDLIDSDFTYRSPRLTRLYEGTKTLGRGAVAAIPFTRVKLSDRRHGGVITNAAVMSMTSGRERTKPITRGAWLAAVVFNDPPDPPPADVPPLAEKPAADEQNLTLRERLVAHRERADCAGCHEKIDPLGFALENYGPIGRWRDRYDNGRKVDISGTLFRRHKFNNIVEFKDAILAEKDRFARGFASHLLSFALGRQVTTADSPTLDRLVRETAAADYRIQTLIKHVALSKPFLQKYNPVASGNRSKEQRSRNKEPTE